MKKLLSIALTLCMILGLCACGGAPAEPDAPETNIQLGFGKAVITPDDPIPLLGYGDSADRMSTQVLDELYVTCLALSDGTNTSLVYSQDLNFSTSNLTPTLRSDISMATRIPQANIFFAATCTYSGPDMKSTHENMVPFMEKYNAAMVQSAQDAMADLSPTTLYTATTQATGMAFVHHYTTDTGFTEDGYYGFFEGKTITGHAAQADETVYLVKAERKDKDDVLLVNFQARPTMTGGFDKTVISADFPGYFRDKITADTGMQVAYFTGGSGNVSPESRIESEAHGMDAKAYGEKLAQIVIEALPSMTLLEGDGAGSYTTNYNCPVHHEYEDKAEQAKQVVALQATEGDAAADALAKELGLRSLYNAAALSVRMTRAEKKSFELSAARLGGLGLTFAPCKVFSDTCQQIREAAPTGFTFVIDEANAAWPCIPSEAGFEYGCYESDTSYYARGSAEKIGKLLCELLIMTAN